MLASAALVFIIAALGFVAHAGLYPDHCRVVLGADLVRIQPFAHLPVVSAQGRSGTLGGPNRLGALSRVTDGNQRHHASDCRASFRKEEDHPKNISQQVLGGFGGWGLSNVCAGRADRALANESDAEPFVCDGVFCFVGCESFDFDLWISRGYQHVGDQKGRWGKGWQSTLARPRRYDGSNR